MKGIKRAVLLINPNSRQGAETDLKSGLATLRTAGIEIEIVETRSAAHSREVIRAQRGKTDLVIIAGGDGTISSAASALYESQIPFAILPLGTANDLAKSLQLPRDLADNFKLIVDTQRRRIDLGKVNDNYFFNVCHLGLGVQITRELSAKDKKSWGVLSYLKALLAAISRRKEFRVTIHSDGESYNLRSLQVSVGNGKYFGGGNMVNDEATIADGLLHLTSIRPKTLWELLYLVPLMRLGKQYKANRTLCLSGKKFRIETRSPRELNIDGELEGHTPAEISVIPSALEVIAPAIEPPRQ